MFKPLIFFEYFFVRWYNFYMKKSLIIVIAFLLITTGFYFYGSRQDRIEAQISTEGWKTYRDDINNFTFLYPPEWEKTSRGVINPRYVGKEDTDQPTESLSLYNGDKWVCPTGKKYDKETQIDNKQAQDTGWVMEVSNYRNLCFGDGLGIHISEVSGDPGRRILTTILSTFKFGQQ